MQNNRHKQNGNQIRIVTNKQIRFPQVRLLGEDREEIGIISSADAYKQALDEGLDLILLSEDAKPPVCFLGAYDKYLYTLQKKEKEMKKSSKQNALKEVQVKPNCGDGDFNRKVNDARKFLDKGSKVKLVIDFRGLGRQMHKVNEIANNVLTNFIKDIENCKKDSDLTISGRRATIVLAPNN